MNEMKYDPSKKTVYVLLEDEFNHNVFYKRDSRRNNHALPYIGIREQVEKMGYNFKPTFDYPGLGEAKDVACIVSYTLLDNNILQSIQKHPREKCFMFVMEPFTNYGFFYDKRLTAYFGKIFVHFDDLIDNKNYFKFYHQQTNEKVVENVPSFEEKKFCLMIQGNFADTHPNSGYPERQKAAKFFGNTNEFDLYGARWSGYRCWRGGLADNKTTLIKNYKFYLAYDNTINQRGYVTDRIFDAFYSKTVPIYLGATNVCDYIPQECFINRSDFGSYEELYLYMKSINKERYQQYIDAAQEFLKSPKAELFSVQQLGKTLCEHLPPVG